MPGPQRWRCSVSGASDDVLSSMRLCGNMCRSANGRVFLATAARCVALFLLWRVRGKRCCRAAIAVIIPVRCASCAQFNLKETEMRIGVLFPIAIIIAGVGLLVWFIASGAYLPGAS